MAETFYQVIQRAIADVSENGFDTEGRIAFWCAEIRRAAIEHLIPESQLDQQLRAAFGQIYTKLVEKGEIAKYHQGVERFTIDKVRPHLRAELDRRIMASASLIKLNRQESIDATIRRFQGWATSIPAGGQRESDKAEATKNVKKKLQQMPYVERRVVIDQSAKLTASINEIIASDGGAIALRWKSHFRQLNYNFRPDHKARDGRIYAMRGNWALKAGLMKAGPDGYYDEITAVAEEPFCRCYAVYIYAIGRLPDDMLTEKGKAELARVRVEAAR